jgi:hypothetical protein
MKKAKILFVSLLLLGSAIISFIPSLRAEEEDLKCTLVWGCRGPMTCGGPGHILPDCELDCNGDMKADIKCDIQP